MPSRITKHYALYMKIFTYPSTRLFTGSSISTNYRNVVLVTHQFEDKDCGF